MNKCIEATTFNELFFKAAIEILHYYDAATGHDQGDIKEIINPTLILHNPYSRIITLRPRKLSLRYLAGELCFYLRGYNLLEYIAPYSKFWNKVSDDGVTVNSNYGYYLFQQSMREDVHQLQYAHMQLLRNPASKKSVMCIYQPMLHSRKTNDNPCTMYMQFFIRDNKLHMVTHMRSNDLWFGLCYDLPFFTFIQEITYVILKEEYKYLEMGDYVHNAGSLHLYTKHWDAAQKCIHLYWDRKNRLDIPENFPRIKKANELLEINTLLDFENRYRRNEICVVPIIKSEFFRTIATMLMEN